MTIQANIYLEKELVQTQQFDDTQNILQIKEWVIQNLGEDKFDHIEVIKI